MHKKCPYCGGEAVCTDMRKYANVPENAYMVECPYTSRCKISIYCFGSTPEEAWEKWDRRYDD